MFAEFNRFDAMHHVTNHYIDIMGPDTAKGRAYLHDVMTTVEPEGQPVVWYGLYDEDYRKVDGKWLISKALFNFCGHKKWLHKPSMSPILWLINEYC